MSGTERRRVLCVFCVVWSGSTRRGGDGAAERDDRVPLGRILRARRGVNARSDALLTFDVRRARPPPARALNDDAFEEGHIETRLENEQRRREHGDELTRRFAKRRITRRGAERRRPRRLFFVLVVPSRPASRAGIRARRLGVRERAIVRVVRVIVRDVVPRVAVVGPVGATGVLGGGFAGDVALAKRLAERHERVAPPDDVREAPVRAPHPGLTRRATRLVRAAQRRGGAKPRVARARASQVLEVEQRVHALGVSVELERDILRVRGVKQIRDERLRATRQAREGLEVRAAVVSRRAVIVARRRREHRGERNDASSAEPASRPAPMPVKKGRASRRAHPLFVFLMKSPELFEGNRQIFTPSSTHRDHACPLGSARRRGAREATAAVAEATSSTATARGRLRAAPRRPRRAEPLFGGRSVNGTF